VSDKLSQLKAQFEEKMKDREAAYQAKIDEITANKDQGTCNMIVVRWAVRDSATVTLCQKLLNL